MILNKIFEKKIHTIFIINLIGIMIGVIFNLFIAKKLSVEDLGVYKILNSYLMFISVFSLLGFSTSNLTLCSKMKKKEHSYRMLENNIISHFFISLIVFFITLFLYKNFIPDNKVRIFFIPYILNIFFAGSVELYQTYFQATKNSYGQISVIVLIRIILPVIYIICFSLIKFSGVIFFIILLQAILYLFLNLRILKKIMYWRKKFFFHNLKIGIYAFASLIIFIFSNNAEIYLMNYFSFSLKELGHYSFSLMIYNLMNQILGVFQNISMPYFIDAKSINQKFFLFRIFKYTLSIFFLSVVMIIGIYYTLQKKD